MFLICASEGCTQALLRSHSMPRWVMFCVGRSSDLSRFTSRPTSRHFSANCMVLWAATAGSSNNKSQSSRYWNVIMLSSVRANCLSGAMASVKTCGIGLRPNGHTVYQYFWLPTWKARNLKKSGLMGMWWYASDRSRLVPHRFGSMCLRISAGVSMENDFNFRNLFTSERSMINRNSGATCLGFAGLGRRNTRLNTTCAPSGTLLMAPFWSNCLTSLSSAICLIEPSA